MTNLVRRESNPQTNPQTLSAWEPFRLMESMLGWNPFSPLLPNSGMLTQQVYSPRFDVKETQDSYVFTADLPGIREEDLDISLTGNQLVISGKRDYQQTKETAHYHLCERSYGRFSRSFALPDGINPGETSAHLKDGVLTLTVGKKPEVQARRIPLNNKAAANA